jgi:transcriptional regulator with XRE-family HTH domain
MVTWRERVGLRLWWARLAAGMSTTELAAELGISRRTVDRIESGQAPPDRYVDRWLEVTGCRMRISLERDDEP